MRHPELATWLLVHRESLIESFVASSERPTLWRGEGEAADATLIDDVIEAARTGQVDHLDVAARQVARQAVMRDISLARLLRGIASLRGTIWNQLKQGELAAPEVLTFIEAAEPIFSRLTRAITQSYIEANQQAQDALASEIARLQHEAERRLMDRTADLTQANIELRKLQQAKTDFISIAAHELKTPLTLIQGYTNMLREMGMEGDGGTVPLPLLEGILRGTERLSAIVEDMLDVSVIDTHALSLRIEQVSLAGAVNIVVTQNAQNLQERNQTVHVGDFSQLPYVEVDARRLHQILTHLLSNAIKYTPDGGEIFIEGRPLPGDRSTDNEFVELTFRDTGIGIAPEDRERIFEKFYRVGKSALHSSGKVKFKGAGPGLGLPIARGLAEAHGGRLWAESPGHDEVNCPGSTFHLVLPIRATPRPETTVTWVEPPPGFLDDENKTPGPGTGDASQHDGQTSQ
jgi:signal transduction histidine kinase